jgi:transposase
MDQTTYYNILFSDEQIARGYLLKKCFKRYQRYCPRCQGRNLYKLRKGKLSKGNFRCANCAYTFHDFSGRWISRGRLSPVKWLTLIRLFEQEADVREIARTVGLNLYYQAAYKAIKTIRLAILSHAEDVQTLLEGDSELAKDYYGGRYVDTREQGPSKIPVFGIMEQTGLVQVMVVPGMSAANVLQLDIKKVRRGNIVYTDKYKDYDSLIFCGYRDLKTDHETAFSKGNIYIDGQEGFWSWAKKRLIRQHGFSKTNFPLYLKELEFRYNNQNNDIFDLVANCLCDLVPTLSGTKCTDEKA